MAGVLVPFIVFGTMFFARSTESRFSHNSGQQIPSQTQAIAASSSTWEPWVSQFP